MHVSRIGQLVVICAPSGTGKSTLVRRLTKEFPDIHFSISCTTRAPRPGEEDGRDYHFIEQDRFKELVAAGYFAEWAEVHGNYYGTPRAQAQELLDQGFDLLFDIDVQGARQIRSNLCTGTYVLLLPPSKRALEERLSARGSDDPATIERRLHNAKTELEAADFFDYWVVNDDLETAYRDLRAVYLAARQTPQARPRLVDALLDQWGQDRG